MAKERFEYCRTCKIRTLLEEHLELPAYEPVYDGKQETPEAFWIRVEQAELLSEALDLYDQLVVKEATRAHTRLETKKQFAERIKKEERQAEADRLRAELLAKGLSEREAQRKLVRQLQPLDGSETRAWPTPNPWNEGRFCRKKADQDRLLSLSNGTMRLRTEEVAVAEAKKRLSWASHRLDERRALVAARQRAQALKAAAPKIRAASAQSPQEPSGRCEECGCSWGMHKRNCRNFIFEKTPHPCDRCRGPIPPGNRGYCGPEGNSFCEDCLLARGYYGWTR